MVDMATNLQALSNSIFPALKIGLIAIFMIIIVGFSLYYFLVIARRKKWICRIWEMKASGKLHYLGDDTLVRQMLDFGKKQIYKFKRSKYYCSNPPDSDSVQRVGNKEYVDYLRVGIAYYPMKTNDEDIHLEVAEVKPKYMQLLNSLKKSIIFTKISETKTEKIYAPMYVPMHRSLVIESKFKPMSYDLDMMRMASVDTREQMYAKNKTFWEKYKEPIVWALLIMSVIIVGYLSFEYMQSVMTQNINLCQSAIERCVNSVPPVVPAPIT
jgi:hypothetical protein